MLMPSLPERQVKPCPAHVVSRGPPRSLTWCGRGWSPLRTAPGTFWSAVSSRIRLFVCSSALPGTSPGACCVAGHLGGAETDEAWVAASATGACAYPGWGRVTEV